MWTHLYLYSESILPVCVSLSHPLIPTPYPPNLLFFFWPSQYQIQQTLLSNCMTACSTKVLSIFGPLMNSQASSSPQKNWFSDIEGEVPPARFSFSFLFFWICFWFNVHSEMFIHNCRMLSNEKPRVVGLTLGWIAIEIDLGLYPKILNQNVILQ